VPKFTLESITALDVKAPATSLAAFVAVFATVLPASLVAFRALLKALVEALATVLAAPSVAFTAVLKALVAPLATVLAKFPTASVTGA